MCSLLWKNIYGKSIMKKGAVESSPTELGVARI
jgi:hypothetical protein